MITGWRRNDDAVASQYSHKTKRKIKIENQLLLYSNWFVHTCTVIMRAPCSFNSSFVSIFSSSSPWASTQSIVIQETPMSMRCHFSTIDTSKKKAPPPTTTISKQFKYYSVCRWSEFLVAIVVLLNRCYCAFGPHGSQHWILFQMF